MTRADSDGVALVVVRERSDRRRDCAESPRERRVDLDDGAVARGVERPDREAGGAQPREERHARTDPAPTWPLPTSWKIDFAVG